jgi:hypothetical protein
MMADIEIARQAEAPGAVISRVPDGPPRPTSRQRAAILIVVALAAEADLAAVAMVAIVLAAIRDLVRDSQVIPHALTWYFGPAPAWYIRRRNRRYLRQQMLDAPTGQVPSCPPGNPSATVRERWNVSRRCTWTNRGHLYGTPAAVPQPGHADAFRRAVA